MKRAYCLLVTILISFRLSAMPAYRGPIVLKQADGSEISARLRGDEFFHILTTDDGSVISKGQDGFYYYSSFSATGKIARSAYRFGGAAPESVVASSRNVAYQTLREQHRISHRYEKASLSSVAELGSEVNALVILIGFKDVELTYKEDSFNNMLNQKGYSYKGATGSARDYFESQSGGTCQFGFDVICVGNASNGRAYYGANGDDGDDVNPAELVYEACLLADPEIDFSRYDVNGDGRVDNIYIFYAGENEAQGGGDDCIWSHCWSLDAAGFPLSLDGVKIDRYAMSSELMRYEDGMLSSPSIGAFCHEFSHILGLKDLYDTDYYESGGQSEGVWGPTSLMDYGCYSNYGRTPPSYNAIELELAGFASGKVLDSGVYTLPPVGTSHKFLKVNTDVEGVVYYLECRAAESWDKYAGGSGLLVYRVDRSDTPSGYSGSVGAEVSAISRWRINEINANPDYMCAKIIPASDPGPYQGGNWSSVDISSIFYPGTLGKYSTVSFEGSPLALSDITRSGNDIKFSVKGPVNLDKVDVFQDAAILSWHLDSEMSGKMQTTLTWTTSGGDWKSVQVLPYQEDTYACTIEGLSPGTKCTFRIVCTDETGYPISIEDSFTTASSYGNQPFIYLASADRYISGAFRVGTKLPLRIYDARKAVNVDWYMDGRGIDVEDDGYYIITAGGTLKAVLHYGDGSTEIIQKKIVAK